MKCQIFQLIALNTMTEKNCILALKKWRENFENKETYKTIQCFYWSFIYSMGIFAFLFHRG
ncbi:hypothetical protein FOL54_04855 [Bartonella quintana]|nr:hypothetical protein FOL54_04855 [Bartonella quintana]